MNSDGFSELAVAHIPVNSDWKDGKGLTDHSFYLQHRGTLISRDEDLWGGAQEQVDGKGSVTRHEGISVKFALKGK